MFKLTFMNLSVRVSHCTQTEIVQCENKLLLFFFFDETILGRFPRGALTLLQMTNKNMQKNSHFSKPPWTPIHLLDKPCLRFYRLGYQF